MEIFALKTWLLFYLVSFAALLWAVFLSAHGVMLWISLLIVILVVGINFVTLSAEVKRNMARKQLMTSLSRSPKKTETNTPAAQVHE